MGRCSIPDLFCLTVKLHLVWSVIDRVLCCPDVFIAILFDNLALIFMFVSLNVSSVPRQYCDSWSMAESYDLFQELNSCVCSRCRTGAWICDHACFNRDLGGEVPSATRRDMQPYFVKCILHVSILDWVDEWINGYWMIGWIVWLINSVENEWRVMNK